MLIFQAPREICDKLPDLTKYKPRLFTTTALQQAKVELTWDATNPNRTELIKSALDGKIDDLDLKDYLASSSSSDDGMNDKSIELLLLSIEMLRSYRFSFSLLHFYS